MNYGKPWEIPETIGPEGARSPHDGCDHDNLIDYIGGLLGFCGCGSPESALMYLRDTLLDIQHRSEVEWKQEPPIYSGKLSARMAALPDGLQYIYWYWLDHLQLIEHGTSVGGSWLTDRGKHLLARLVAMNLEEMV